MGIMLTRARYEPPTPKLPRAGEQNALEPRRPEPGTRNEEGEREGA